MSSSGRGVMLRNAASGRCLASSDVLRGNTLVGANCRQPGPGLAPLYELSGDKVYRLRGNGQDCMVYGTKANPVIFRPGTCGDNERTVQALDLPRQ